MAVATPSLDAAVSVRPKTPLWRRLLRPFGYLSLPTILLLLLFVGPMLILAFIAFGFGFASEDGGFTTSNFTAIFDDPLYGHVALTTLEIATIAMLVQLVIAVPLAYVMAFKAGRFEIPLLLALVLADELNPMVRIYSWRMLLGREGIINSALESLGLISHPIDALLFNKFAVILVLSTSYITYTAIPIYASMKAIDGRLFEAALDMGASWFTIIRKILLPLIAPGVFVALLLVYIPLFTEFATPTLVGGSSGYMLGSAVQDLILQDGDLGGGAALSLMLLVGSGIFAAIAYRLSRISRLET
jgi:spermidine/putrescine transport system permease protein